MMPHNTTANTLIGIVAQRAVAAWRKPGVQNVGAHAVAAAIVLVVLLGAGISSGEDSAQTDGVTQTAPLNANAPSADATQFGWTVAWYPGDVPVARRLFPWNEMTGYGDTGLGILSNLSLDPLGEVVGVGGEWFAVVGETGKVRKLRDDDLSPFATIINLDPERTIEFGRVASVDALQVLLDEEFRYTESQLFVFHLKGNATSLRYIIEGPPLTPELTEYVKDGQAQVGEAAVAQLVKSADDVEIEVVGIRAPPATNVLFEVPYHYHFVSTDRSLVGHVIDMNLESASVSWMRVERLDWHNWAAD